MLVQSLRYALPGLNRRGAYETTLASSFCLFSSASCLEREADALRSHRSNLYPWRLSDSLEEATNLQETTSIPASRTLNRWQAHTPECIYEDNVNTRSFPRARHRTGNWRATPLNRLEEPVQSVARATRRRTCVPYSPGSEDKNYILHIYSDLTMRVNNICYFPSNILSKHSSLPRRAHCPFWCN